MSDSGMGELQNFVNNIGKEEERKREMDLEDIFEQHGMGEKQFQEQENQRFFDNAFKDLYTEEKNDVKNEDLTEVQNEIIIEEKKEEVIGNVRKSMPMELDEHKHEVEKKRDAAALPQEFTDVISSVLAENKSIKFFGSVKEAVTRLTSATDEAAAAAAMADVLKEARGYLEKRSAWTLSPTTWRRRNACKSLIKQIADFMGNAPSAYLEKVTAVTKGEGGIETDPRYRDFISDAGNALETAGVSRDFKKVISDRRFNERSEENESPESDIKYGIESIGELSDIQSRFLDADKDIPEDIKMGYLVQINRTLIGCRNYVLDPKNTDIYMLNSIEQMRTRLSFLRGEYGFDTSYPVPLRWKHILGQELSADIDKIFEENAIEVLGQESLEAIRGVDINILPVLFDDVMEGFVIEKYMDRLGVLKLQIEDKKLKEEANGPKVITIGEKLGFKGDDMGSFDAMVAAFKQKKGNKNDIQVLEDLHGTAVYILSKLSGMEPAVLDAVPTATLRDVCNEAITWLEKDDEADLEYKKEIIKASASDMLEQSNNADYLVERYYILERENRGVGTTEAKKQELRDICAAIILSKAKDRTYGRKQLVEMPVDKLSSIALNAVLAMDVLDVNGTLDDKRMPEEISESRDAALALLTDTTGMARKEFIRLPTADIISLAAGSMNHLEDQKATADGIKEKIAALEQKYNKDYLEKEISDLYAAKKKDPVSVRNLRELCLLALDKNAEDTTLDDLDNISLVVMAMNKFSAKEENELAKLESGLGLMQANSVRVVTKEKQNTQEYKDKKAAARKQEKKTWSINAKYTLSFFGDIFSGESVYDKNGNVVPANMRMAALLEEYTPCLMRLIEGRKAELAGNPTGPLNELLSGAKADDAAMLVCIKDALDPVLDSIIEKEGENKLKPVDVKRILKSDETAALVAGMDAKITAGMQKHIKRIEGEIDLITENVYEEMTEGFGSLWDEEKKEAAPGKDLKADLEKLSRSRDDAFSMKTGHGRFIANIMRDYYKLARPEEKRFMFSCVLKDIQPRQKGRMREDTHMQAGRYYASMMKGAGPMMQKILQGIPERTIKQEFQTALQVVKSDLRPIPDSYVNAKLRQIQNDNKETISSINVLRPLGAASIAQTFLCEITGPKIEGKKEVVIKIQRPDAFERYNVREKNLILDIARKSDTSGVTEAGIMAQMNNVDNELDFTNEAKNCAQGKVYNKNATEKDESVVKSVKVAKEIKTTREVMAMDKAEGVTIDRYIDELRKLEKECMQEFYVGVDPVTLKKKYAVTPENSHKLKEMRDKAAEALVSARIRQEHLIGLTKKWIVEALFGDGFQHGDMHAGNIMVNDEGATVLDFGNCNKFDSSAKRKLLVKMMMAALFGKPKIFVRDFRKLLSEEKNGDKLMNDVQAQQLELELTEVFKLGGGEHTGDRIFVALMKAQQLGIKIPPAVQNFSACEQRFENTITEFNERVRSLQFLVDKLDTLGAQLNRGTKTLDPVSDIHYRIGLDEERKYKPQNNRVKRCNDALSELGYVNKEYIQNRLENLDAQKEEKMMHTITDSLRKKNRLKEKYNIDVDKEVPVWRETYEKALVFKHKGEPVPPELRAELDAIYNKIKPAFLRMSFSAVFGDTGGMLALVKHAFSQELDEDKFEEFMYYFESIMPVSIQYSELAKDALSEYKDALAPKKKEKKGKGLQETKENIAERFAEYYKFTYDLDYCCNDNLYFVHMMLCPDQNMTDEDLRDRNNKKKMTPKQKADYLRKLIDDQRALVEFDLNNYFKQHNDLRKHYDLFRKAQNDHLKAIEEGRPTAALFKEKYSREMRFLETYKSIMQDTILEHKEILKDKVNTSNVPDNFIDAMQQCFNWKRFLQIFPLFGYGYGEYLPDDPKQREEIEKQIAEEKKKHK